MIWSSFRPEKVVGIHFGRLTHSLLGILQKSHFEDSQAAFWTLSGYIKPKLPKTLFIRQAVCGLPFQMQKYFSKILSSGFQAFSESISFSPPIYFAFSCIHPPPLFFPFAGHLLGFISEEEVSGKAFKRILGLDFSIHCVIVFFPFLWPPWLKHTNHHLSSSLLLHKLEDVKLSLPVKTDDITISKTRDVDPQRCLVTGGSGANGLKMKGFRWNSWDCNTTWYPLFNALLLFTVGLSIILLRFDCMTIFLC